MVVWFVRTRYTWKPPKMQIATTIEHDIMKDVMTDDRALRDRLKRLSLLAMNIPSYASGKKVHTTKMQLMAKKSMKRVKCL